MSVRVQIPTERPCGECGVRFTPAAVLTWPDPKRDRCPACADAFLRRMLIPIDRDEQETGQ